MGGRQGLQQWLDGPDQGVGVEGQGARGHGPRGPPQLLDHAARPQRLGGDGLDDLQRLGGVAGITPEQQGRAVGVGRNGGERLVELVGDAGRQVPQEVLVGIGRRLRPRAAQLIIESAHVNGHPMLAPAGPL
jgi:hypothetical protein